VNQKKSLIIIVIKKNKILQYILVKESNQKARFLVLSSSKNPWVRKLTQFITKMTSNQVYAGKDNTSKVIKNNYY